MNSQALTHVRMLLKYVHIPVTKYKKHTEYPLPFARKGSVGPLKLNVEMRLRSSLASFVVYLVRLGSKHSCFQIRKSFVSLQPVRDGPGDGDPRDDDGAEPLPQQPLQRGQEPDAALACSAVVNSCLDCHNFQGSTARDSIPLQSSKVRLLENLF